MNPATTLMASHTTPGVPAYKYLLANSTYKTTADFPANCAYANDAPHGTFNVTAYKNAPVHMSKPFFMDADPSYRANINGLRYGARF
jgi:hypothetical protein